MVEPFYFIDDFKPFVPGFFRRHSLKYVLFFYRLIDAMLGGNFKGSLLKLKLKFWSNVLYLGSWEIMG